MLQGSLHLLSGLEKGVSGVLFAPMSSLVRSVWKTRLGLESAKTASNAQLKKRAL